MIKDGIETQMANADTKMVQGEHVFRPYAIMSDVRARDERVHTTPFPLSPATDRASAHGTTNTRQSSSCTL